MDCTYTCTDVYRYTTKQASVTTLIIYFVILSPTDTRVHLIFQMIVIQNINENVNEQLK